MLLWWWRSGDMQIPPGSHSTSLCFCVRAHMYEHISVMKCLLGLCMCFVCVLLSCATRHMYPPLLDVCVPRTMSEPASRSLAKNLFIHPGRSSVERGDTSWTAAAPGSGGVPALVCQETSTAALPWAAINQFACCSHSTHIYFSLRAVRYANASGVCCCWVILPCCRAFFLDHTCSLSGSCDYLKLCHESMKSSSRICVPLCKQLLDLIMLFFTKPDSYFKGGTYLEWK